MMYKVCILAAGVTRRIGDFSDYVNKAVLPVNAKAVISYIIDKFPEDVEVVIAVGHRKTSIIDYLTLAYPTRKFTFVEVERYVGEGTGPGQSLLECKDHLQCPFIVSAADTIVKEDVPAPTENWFGIAPVAETEQFCTVQFGNGKVTRIDDKIKTDNTHAFIGLAGVHDYKEFFQALQTNREVISGEIQISNGFQALLKSGLATKEFTWFDTGTLEGFTEVNKHFDPEMFETSPNEFTYLIGKRVIKFFANEKEAHELLTKLEGRSVTLSAGRHFSAFDLGSDTPERWLPRKKTAAKERAPQSEIAELHVGYPIFCVGPMSKTIVDTVIAYAHKNKIPLYLIASRAQVETEALGGGYANGWNTEDFAAYVREQLTKTPADVLICRDHGGPWLGRDERPLAYKHAMLAAKASFEADIASGFSMIHIDTSVDPNGTFDMEASLQRAFELLEFCQMKAKQYGTTLHFEIGTEDADGGIVEPENFEHFLKRIVEYCGQHSIPKPRFIVGRTGTLVKETHQAGSFNFENTKKIVEIAKKYGVGIKEHNVDYDKAEHLPLRAKAGIAAINVAPQFGVIETKETLAYCKKHERMDLYEEFLELAYESKRWKKWLVLPDQTTKLEKAIIAGHYVFGTEQFQAIRKELGKEYERAMEQAIWDKIDWYVKRLRA